jgi:hypothetical protein
MGGVTMNPQIPPQAFSKIAPRERPAPRYVNNTYGNRGYRRRILTPIPPSGPPENPFLYYDAAQILADMGIDPDSVQYSEESEELFS